MFGLELRIHISDGTLAVVTECVGNVTDIVTVLKYSCSHIHNVGWLLVGGYREMNIVKCQLWMPEL